MSIDWVISKKLTFLWTILHRWTYYRRWRVNRDTSDYDSVDPSGISTMTCPAGDSLHFLCHCRLYRSSVSSAHITSAIVCRSAHITSAIEFWLNHAGILATWIYKSYIRWSMHVWSIHTCSLLVKNTKAKVFAKAKNSRAADKKRVVWITFIQCWFNVEDVWADVLFIFYKSFVFTGWIVSADFT